MVMTSGPTRMSMLAVEEPPAFVALTLKVRITGLGTPTAGRGALNVAVEPACVRFTAGCPPKAVSVNRKVQPVQPVALRATAAPGATFTLREAVKVIEGAVADAFTVMFTEETPPHVKPLQADI